MRGPENIIIPEFIETMPDITVFYPRDNVWALSIYICIE